MIVGLEFSKGDWLTRCVRFASPEEGRSWLRGARRRRLYEVDGHGLGLARDHIVAMRALRAGRLLGTSLTAPRRAS